MLELNFSQTLGNHCLTINETLPANGITAIFGVSGAGKTSLINAISGLTRPQKGRIVLNGRVLNDAEKGICLTPEKRRVGYVFQDARLFPHYKVRGNLRYGMSKSMVDQFDKLVKCCPAGLYRYEEDGSTSFDYAGCLECGTCRILCGNTIVSKWENPAFGNGVSYRFG